MKVQESSPLFSKETYLVKNHNITEIDKQLPTDSVDIGPDDEVWLLQCPKSIDVNALINRQIKLPGKAHHEHIESVAQPYPRPENISLGVCTRQGYKIKSLPIVGNICIRQHIKIQNFDDVNNESRANLNKKAERVKFPDNLKIRHPLLGADYQEMIEIRPDVAARLKDAATAGIGVKRSKQPKSGMVRVKVEGESKSKKSIGGEVRVKVERASSEAPTVEVKKELKRKRKHDDEASTPQRSKKIKIEKIDDKKDLEWIAKF